MQSISASGSRVFACDMTRSITLLHILPTPSTDLAVIADDVVPRLFTAAAVADENTVCGGDKFGNVFVLRMPVGTVGPDDANSLGTPWDTSYLGPASLKVHKY